MPTDFTPDRASWPSHLHLRATRYYARLRVPPSLGYTQTHLQKSLKTSRYAEAVKRLPVILGDLRIELERLRQIADGRPDQRPKRRTVEAEAAWWRARVEAAGGDPNRGIPQALEPEWEAAIEARQGAPLPDDLNDPSGPTHENEAEAVRLADLVFGRIIPVESQLDRFVEEGSLSTRYADRHRRAARRLRDWMLKRYGTDDPRRDAGEFVDHLLASGLSSATSNSLISSLRVYWAWLGDRVGIEGNPWTNQTRKPKKAEKTADKRPFTDDEVTKLLNGGTTATNRDLMFIGALSGMRIDEIARLTVDGSADGVFRITEGKTDASVREVPIHPALRGVVARRREGKEGQDRLFDELKAPPSRKKELSAKASERFTAYRRAMGVDERVEGQRQSNIDFHSFRRWFITKAEMAGQPPHVISSVVGHVEGRKGMTLGTYSGGPSIAQRRTVVEAVTLPVGVTVTP